MNTNADKKLYCLGGLGTDEKIFSHLHLGEHQLKFIPFIKPEKKESIAHYAKRMAEKMDDENPWLLGVSFGGMLAIEIAKQRPVDKLILVSSISHYHQLPRWMRICGLLKLNRILPMRPFRFLEGIQNRRMGATSEEEKELLRLYRQQADFSITDWSIDQILNWKNNWTPANLYHIHGTHDQVFPIQKLKPTHVVREGTHLMVVNKGERLCAFIKEILEN